MVRCSLLLACALLAVLCCAASPARAHNPFLAQPGKHAANQTAPTPGAASDAGHVPVPEARLAGSVYVKLMLWQKALRHELTRAIRAVRQSRSAADTALFLLLAFAYGMLHAAGPGHGKSIALGYFLSRRGTVRQALAMGALMGLFHALSATCIVLLAFYALKFSVMAALGHAGEVLERLSGACIALVGLWLFVRAAADLARGKRLIPDEEVPGAANRSVAATAAATGLVPCPGASIVLFFALTQGMPLFGLAAVAAMALGMGATIAAAAVAVVVGREKTLVLARARPRAFALAHGALECLGGLVVLALGGILFFGSL